MATIMLVDGFDQLVQASEDVTFQLPTTVGGQVPLTVPYEVFGSNNQYTLENPGDPSVTCAVGADPPQGSFLVTWETDDGSSSTSRKQGPSPLRAKRQHQGTIRVGTASAA